MDDLEKRLKKDSEYTKEEQEFDGAVGYNLPSPKDLINYYTPSGVPNVERYEKAILNTNGELPSKWVLDLTEEQIDELNTYSPDFVNHLSDVSNYYQDAIDVENDITETAARRTATREGWNNISNSVTGFGYVPKEGEVAKPFDYEAEFKKALDEVTQEKLGTTMAMFETEDRAMETVVNEKLPNNVQEGMLGKAWNKFKDNVSNSYRVGVYKGNQQFRPGSENIEQPEDMSMGMISKIVITGKFGSWLASRMFEPFNNYSEISSSEERQIQGVEQGRDLAIKQFKAVSQKETWNSAMNSSPHVANEILKLFGGDEMKAQAVFHTMTMANSPELMDANNNYMEAVFEASTEKVKKIVSGEDTIGEAIVDSLGYYSKHFVGSISTGLLLLGTGETQRMAAESNLLDSIRKFDYSPAKVLGMEGTFTGSMIDLGTSFAFDPTVWFFNPGSAARLGALKQFGHAKYVKGFMNKGLGKAFADDLYKVLRDGTTLQKRALLRNFSEKNQANLKNVVKGDKAKGTAEITSELFYKHYTDSLLQGDNPYVFHKNAWNKLKAKRTSHIIEKASQGDGKALKSFSKLLTSKNISTKVNLAGPNPRRSIMDAIESMVEGTRLPEDDIARLINGLEEQLEELYELTLNKGTNFQGSKVAAIRTQIVNQSDLLNHYEMALGKRSRNIIKNLDDRTTASGQSIKNLEDAEVAKQMAGVDMPVFSYKTFGETIKMNKAKLKKLQQSKADPDLIARQKNYIRKLVADQDGKSRRIFSPGKGTKQGEIIPTDLVKLEDLAADKSFMKNVETRRYMQRLMEDANELAGLAPEAKETIEKSTRFNSMMDDFYTTLDEIIEGTSSGSGQKEIAAHILKTHHKLSNKLDNLIKEYDELLNTSIRGLQQNAMLDTLNNIVVKLEWHDYDRFKGGWFYLRKGKGEELYEQAVRIESKVKAQENLLKTKSAEAREIAEGVAKGEKVYFIENPIKITKNKKGVITKIDIDWATLKVMMNYKDEIGAASAVLRGQSKMFDEGLKARPAGKFSLNESEDAFLAAGRKYNDQFIRDLKKNFKLKRDMPDEEVMDYIEGIRELKRTTNQVVEGELPISPLEFSVINAAVEGQNPIDLFRRLNEKRWYQVIDQFQRTWAWEKVIRPSTAWVAALDELMFWRSIHGWDGVAKEYKLHRDVRRTLKKIKKYGSTDRAMENPALAEEINKWVSEALERQQQLPMEVAQRYKVGFDKSAPVELLSNTDAGFFQYAQQHIEGLLRDRGFQQYAQTIDRVRKLKPEPGFKGTLEVSTKGNAFGKKFSALNAEFKTGPYAGRTIEDVWQNEIKKSGKGKPPGKGSILRKDDFAQSKAEYQKLWEQWLEQNPTLKKQLQAKVDEGFVLKDSWATGDPNKTVNQAEALTNILKSKTYKTQKEIDDMFAKGTDDDWMKWFSTDEADYIKGIKLYGYKQGQSPINSIYAGLKKKPVPTQHHLTNAEEGWKYYQSLKKWYTMGVPKQYVDDVWNSFIKASLERTKTGGNLKALPDAKHIGRIKVPGVRKPNGFLSQTRLGKLMARETSVMEQMFGNPAWNRANLFANKAHAGRAAQLETLFKSQGKEIIRAEDITQGFGIATEAVDPRFQSDMWGMSYFDEQLFNNGKVTENYINALAADFATNEIDDMMLKFHLATPIGKDMRFLAPFGGPYVDFWGRYLKDLSRRSHFRGNWFHFTDEKQSLNFARKSLNDVVNYLPNMRRFGYMSRVANAELKGTIPNPLSSVGLGEDRIMVDFSPITFLPNGDSPMFAVNPIGGVIPIALLGTAMNILDDDAYFELQDTLEDLFPSTQFFPPEEKWKHNLGPTAMRYIFGGGVLNQTMRSLDVVSRMFGMQEVPQSIDDVSTQLKMGRSETNWAHNKTSVILGMETNWETIGDFTKYVNDLAQDARNNAALTASTQATVRLGVPLDVKFSTRYTDVADNWIDFAETVGIYDDVVRDKSKELLKQNPYNEDNKVEVLNDLRRWWFKLGDTNDGRAQQLLLAKQYPEIYSMTVPGYTVTELGERLLPELEGKIYEESDVFRTGTQDNSSVYSDYLAEGLIQVRLPDQKIKHIIHENAAWVVNAVPVIYEKMAEITNQKQAEKAEAFGERRDISAAEILVNADMREYYGIELASSDVKNIENISSKIKGRNYSVEDLGPEVTALIQEVLKGTEYENPINGLYNPTKIIPYLYAAHKSGKLDPSYVFSSQDSNTQQFNKGIALLTGLTEAQTYFDEDIDGPEQLEFLTKFEHKLYALKELWETNEGQIANNDEIQDLVQDLFSTFTIFNHIMGDINTFEGKDIMSGEQWWNFYIKPTFKALDLEWKQPVPAEGEVNDQTFSVTLFDKNVDAEFQTIIAKKPFKAVKIKATSENVPDGDTINSMYSSSDTESIRVIGIMAYETSADPVVNKREREIAIEQKAFLQQLVDRYQGRLYYVTDARFGNEDRRDPYKRVLGWLFVENGINGDLADGQGEYIFFSDHFSPADNYYDIKSKGPVTDTEFGKAEPTQYDLEDFTGKIEVDE